MSDYIFIGVLLLIFLGALELLEPLFIGIFLLFILGIPLILFFLFLWAVA